MSGRTDARAKAQAKAGRLAQRRALEEQIARPTEDEGEQRRMPAAPSPDRVARTKPVRISLDLAPQLYRDLTEWNGQTADALGRSRITHADTLRSLVRRLLNDPELAASVVDDLRSQ
jgi:hypothetical protein